MSVPKPPFHSAMEELLYNIYLKLSDNTSMSSFSANDINTLAKLNAILTDADLMKAEDVTSAVNAIKGNVPAVADTLEKLYGIIQALNFLKAEDIDTLAELNAILSDADVIKADDLTNAINQIKGNVPAAGNTLEKLYGIIQAMNYLKREDLDTLAELNAILVDADVIKTEDLTNAINDLKDNVPLEGETLGKLYIMMQPIRQAFVFGGNNTGSARPIGTKDNYALPFITNNIERARIDENGKFLIGFQGAGIGRFHIRTADVLETNFATYVEDPTLAILFGVANSGKVFINKDRTNVLVNGGWPSMTGLRNLIITSGTIGGKLVDTGNDNVIIGYHAASSAGANPTRNLQRNVVIGAEAGSADVNGSSYLDSVYIGYRAGMTIGLGTGRRNVMIGVNAGATALQAGNDHTIVGANAQNARSNSFNTLLGSATRAYNSFGDLVTNGGGLTYMTAIGAESVVRTSNTVVLGRAGVDNTVIGAESSNLQLPGTTANTGFSGYRLQVVSNGSLALGVSGSSWLRDGNVTINLGEEGNAVVKNAFKINSYITGLGGYDFILSANNANAVLEITDQISGGTKNEMIRLTPGANANTCMMIRPSDVSNASYGYRYLLQGTNVNQQNRFISAFYAQLTFGANDVHPADNRAQLFSARAAVTNHYFIDGYFADIRGTDPNAQVYAFRSLGSRSYFDGSGMTFNTWVVGIITDGAAHAGANNSLANGSYITSAGLFIVPYGAERTGLMISPGQKNANGLFISSQQTLGTMNYDGYMLWVQYSTGGNSLQGGTTKPMVYIRKHNVPLNGFDHAGAFIRMEENIGSTGPFIEAFKYNTSSNTLKLKFSVDRDGVITLGQINYDPVGATETGKLYFKGDELRYVRSTGEVMVIQANVWP
jgi:hypothetical protein